MTFSVPTEKEMANRTKNTMTYGTKFVDGLRFMVNSLPNLAYNFAEGPCNSKCKEWKLYLLHVNVNDCLLLFSCSD